MQHAANAAALSEASGGAAEGQTTWPAFDQLAPIRWAATMRGLEPRKGTRANNTSVRATGQSGPTTLDARGDALRRRRLAVAVILSAYLARTYRCSRIEPTSQQSTARTCAAQRDSAAHARSAEMMIGSSESLPARPSAWPASATRSRPARVSLSPGTASHSSAERRGGWLVQYGAILPRVRATAQSPAGDLPSSLRPPRGTQSRLTM
jgi:hypothetical protein